jgi:hypothetical protein
MCSGYIVCCTPQVDHFSFTSNATFRLRYLQNATYWRKHQAQPMFFYTGNEGDIEMFAQNTVQCFCLIVAVGTLQYSGSVLCHAGGI